jgi:prephenate dehydratase
VSADAVMYLGPAGTFAEVAVRSMQSIESAEARPAPSVIAAIDAVRAGTARAAVVPIENSVEGSVSGTLDEIAADPPLRIMDEIAIPVRFALMRRPDRVDRSISAVGTHPHAAAQCRRWIHENLPGADIVLTSSTAGAAEELADAAAEAAYDAAIAPALAAQRYGLVLVADDIGDNREALTRFVRVEQPGALPAPTGADKTSLVLFMRANRAGALLEILTELSVRGINMTRLESRPTRHALGDYCFSVDIEGHVAEARIGEALMGLRRACSDVLFLGSYPRHDNHVPDLPVGVSDADYEAADAWLRAIREGRRPATGQH